MKETMRCGYTTGSCAAAAVKAALLLLTQKEKKETVDLRLPQGGSLLIPIREVQLIPGGARAIVLKDSGDDPDITKGMPIVADVAIDETLQETKIEGGRGVGTVTKPGLSVPVGMPAINPVPRQMIHEAAKEALGEGRFCRIVISLPEGEALAKRTLNPILGIEGGLSIIGTSGIVRPMSEEAFKDSLTPQISVAKAAGYDTLVFVPGKIGENAAVNRYGLPQAAIVQTSNFIGHMLENAAAQNIKRVLLFGHLGKIVKVAGGIFHTHNRVADARLETLGAYLAVLGAPSQLIRETLAAATAEAVVPLIQKYRLESVYEVLAKRASLRAERYVFQQMQIGTVMLTLKGEILGFDGTAAEIGEALRWNIR